jgi:hypothetical protein
MASIWRFIAKRSGGYCHLCKIGQRTLWTACDHFPIVVSLSVRPSQYLGFAEVCVRVCAGDVMSLLRSAVVLFDTLPRSCSLASDSRSLKLVADTVKTDVLHLVPDFDLVLRPAFIQAFE